MRLLRTYLLSSNRLMTGILLVMLVSGCSGLPVSERSYPPLWRVEHPDSNGAVWIFGTVHVLPPGRSPEIAFVRKTAPSRLQSPLLKPEWVSPGLNLALRRIDTLVLELDYSQQRKRGTEKKNTIKQSFGNNKGIHELTPLFSHLDEAEKQQIIDAGAQRGLQPDDLEKLSAPSTLFMFSVLPRRDSGLNELRGVEDWLLAHARLNRRQLAGLETPALRLEAIASAMQNIEPAQQPEVVLDYLRSSIEEAEDPLDELTELYELWRSGELDEVSRKRALFAEYYPIIYEAFLAYRNRAWIPEVVKYLNNDKDVLIAVGQGHLIGPDNLLDLLRAQNYQVSRIN